MAQFDVYRNGDAQSRARIPFLVDIQSDILSDLKSRVVVPLVAADSFGIPASRLNPRFRIANRQVILSTAELAGVDRRELGPSIASLASARDEIIAAIDLLITGI